MLGIRLGPSRKLTAQVVTNLVDLRQCDLVIVVMAALGFWAMVPSLDGAECCLVGIAELHGGVLVFGYGMNNTESNGTGIVTPSSSCMSSFPLVVGRQGRGLLSFGPLLWRRVL